MNNADLGARIILTVREIPALNDLLIRVIHIHPGRTNDQIGLEISPAVTNARGVCAIRINFLDIVDGPPDLVKVLHGELNVHPLLRRLITGDHDLIAHQIVDPAVHAILDTAADRDDKDHGRNAYDDAQHGQEGPSLIAPDIHQGDFYVF